MFDPKSLYKTAQHGHEVRIYAHGDYLLMGAYRSGEQKWIGCTWSIATGHATQIGQRVLNTGSPEQTEYALVPAQEPIRPSTQPITKWVVFGKNSAMAYDNYDKAKQAVEKTTISILAIVPVTFKPGEGLGQG